MAFCGNRYSTCHSPDGKWSIVYVNRSPGSVSYNYTNGQVSGYDPLRVGCTLIVTQLTTGRREQIHLRAQPCDRGLWLGDTYVVQDESLGGPDRLLSVELPSRQVKVLARFGSDVVSPNGRWIAGEAELHHGARWLIAVLSLPSQTCRVAAEGRSGPHVFGQDVAVDRSPWEFVPSRLGVQRSGRLAHRHARRQEDQRRKRPRNRLHAKQPKHHRGEVAGQA